MQHSPGSAASSRFAPADFAAIVAGLKATTAEGEAPYIAQEVMAGGTRTLAPSAFTANGDVLGFSYADALHNHFTDYFLLAYPHGKPFVYDGFTFSDDNTADRQ